MKEFIIPYSDELNDDDVNALYGENRRLVRCKDCKYYNAEPDSNGDRCDRIHWSLGDGWFCAAGRKKDGMP